ncbi:MAG: peptidoglycan DD-metalloendopeptidase family protein [Chloroflexota bacterium]
MFKRIFSSFCLFTLFFTLLLPAGLVFAQGTQPAGPVYIVQPGDSLWGIAARFGVSIDDLARANGITSDAPLVVDARLVIPGLEGIQGVLTTETLPYGETLRSLSRRYQIPQPLLARLNHVTSPNELYTGANLVITQPADGQLPGRRVALAAGQSLLELAVLNDANPWELVDTNQISGTWAAIPADVLRVPHLADEGPGALPPDITVVEIVPLPFEQGATGVIALSAGAGLSLSGSFADRELHFFFDAASNQYIAMQGVHAMTEPGFYPLVLKGALPDGTSLYFSQLVYVRDGGYPYDPPLNVKDETVDPEITEPEDALWFSMAEAVSEPRQWDGLFANPSPYPLDTGFASTFGNRRSYNGSAYTRFHGGLDMYGNDTTDIYAAAPGQVVFAGPLAVRGNAVLIDHGWGVYTGYAHLSQSYVQQGDRVEPGQVIGKVGDTGRVNGPHLHFEVLINGVQVDPLDWLTNVYP